MADTQQGFTLIETLVALSLMALVSVSVYSVFSTSIRGSEKSENAILAVRLAKSKLNELSLAGALEMGTQQGTTDHGFDWTFEATPVDRVSIRDASVPSAAIAVTVGWGEAGNRQSFTLRSFRLVYP